MLVYREQNMAMRKVQVGAILAVVTTVVVVGVLASTLLMAYQTIPNTGNVKAAGVYVYWDSECTNNVTTIDWGFLPPGAATNLPVYVKNGGTVPVILSMTTENWDPSQAAGNVTLSWNRENHVLSSGAVVQAVLTLSISADIDGVSSFSFDIIMTGTEQSA
jgi:hypothetical protein